MPPTCNFWVIGIFLGVWKYSAERDFHSHFSGDSLVQRVLLRQVKGGQWARPPAGPLPVVTRDDSAAGPFPWGRSMSPGVKDEWSEGGEAPFSDLV